MQDFSFTNGCPTHNILILHIFIKDGICVITLIYSSFKFPNDISFILYKFTKDFTSGLTVIYIIYKIWIKDTETSYNLSISFLYGISLSLSLSLFFNWEMSKFRFHTAKSKLYILILWFRCCWTVLRWRGAARS